MVDNHELLVGKLYVILDKAMDEYENPEDCAQDFREYTDAWLASRTNSEPDFDAWYQDIFRRRKTE